jgi:hypothetical protein
MPGAIFLRIEIEMDKEKREDEIYELRRQGLTYRNIASLYNIHKSRAEQIYKGAKYKREVLPTLTPLRRLLSNRTQKALVKHFGGDDILDEPQKIAELGRKRLLRVCNIGRISLREISSTLHFLGFIKDEHKWL